MVFAMWYTLKGQIGSVASFAFVLKLAGLVKIAHNRRGGESCLAQAKRSVMRGGGLGINGLFFDDRSGFLHVSE